MTCPQKFNGKAHKMEMLNVVNGKRGWWCRDHHIVIECAPSPLDELYAAQPPLPA